MISDHLRTLPRNLDVMAVNSRDQHAPLTPPLYPVYAGYSRWSQRHSFERRHSGIFAVEVVTRGSALFTRGGTTQEVAAPHAFLLRKGTAHRYEVGTGGLLHKRFVVMDGPILDLLLRSLGLASTDVVRVVHPAEVTGILRRIFVTLQRPREGMYALLSMMCYELLLELSLSRHPQYPALIDQALAYMESRLGGWLPSGEISGHVGLSATHFNRLFRRHVGKSPIQYFIGQKMTWARHLLEQTSMSVKEIAATLGYEDPLYFSSQFKKHAGVAPKLFRSGAGTRSGETVGPRAGR